MANALETNLLLIQITIFAVGVNYIHDPDSRCLFYGDKRGKRERATYNNVEKKEMQLSSYN